MEDPGPPVRSRSPKHSPTQEGTQKMRAGRSGPAEYQECFSPQEWAQKMRTEKGSREARSTAEARNGPCPVCKEKHVYTRKLAWGVLSWPSSRLHDCNAFVTLSPPQRAKVIQEQGGCVICLSWMHPRVRCNMKAPKNPGLGAASLLCQERDGTGVCGQAHHRMLHGSKAADTSENAVVGAPRGHLVGPSFREVPPFGPLLEFGRSSAAGHGGFRPDWFSGRPMGSLLAEGTAGGIFEIVEAPVA